MFWSVFTKEMTRQGENELAFDGEIFSFIIIRRKYTCVCVVSALCTVLC